MLVSGATHEGTSLRSTLTNAETVGIGTYRQHRSGIRAIGMREQQCCDAGIDYETSVIWCEDLTARSSTTYWLLQDDRGPQDTSFWARISSANVP